MGRTVAQLRQAVRKLWVRESCARGSDREEVGFLALLFAKFLRNDCVGRDASVEILALAEEVEQIGWRCLEQPEPRGQA